MSGSCSSRAPNMSMRWPPVIFVYSPKSRATSPITISCSGLISSQQINGIRTYLKSNPVPATATTAVTVWEDPAYVSVASPTTVVNPTTIVTNEVRTPPVVTRQVQVPVVSGSVPVVVKDPVPVVRNEVSVPAVIKTETAPVNVTRTEEVTKVRTETKNSSSKSSSEKKDEKKND